MKLDEWNQHLSYIPGPLALGQAEVRDEDGRFDRGPRSRPLLENKWHSLPQSLRSRTLKTRDNLYGARLAAAATTASQLLLPPPRLTAEFSSALAPASQDLQCANAASGILSTEPGHWVPELHFQGPCPLLPKDRESQRRTQKRVSPATHGPGAFPPWHLCVDYYTPLFKHMSCFPGKSAKIGSQFHWFRGSWASKFSNIYTLPTILNCMPYFFKSAGQKKERKYRSEHKTVNKLSLSVRTHEWESPFKFLDTFGYRHT